MASFERGTALCSCHKLALPIKVCHETKPAYLIDRYAHPRNNLNLLGWARYKTPLAFTAMKISLTLFLLFHFQCYALSKTIEKLDDSISIDTQVEHNDHGLILEVWISSEAEPAFKNFRIQTKATLAIKDRKQATIVEYKFSKNGNLDSQRESSKREFLLQNWRDIPAENFSEPTVFTLRFFNQGIVTYSNYSNLNQISESLKGNGSAIKVEMVSLQIWGKTADDGIADKGRLLATVKMSEKDIQP